MSDAKPFSDEELEEFKKYCGKKKSGADTFGIDHEVSLRLLATIVADRKRIEELKKKIKAYIQGGVYVTGWNDGCRIMTAKNEALQSRLESMEGALKKIASWDCCCADSDGKCGVCVARQALKEKP